MYRPDGSWIGFRPELYWAFRIKEVNEFSPWYSSIVLGLNVLIVRVKFSGEGERIMFGTVG